MSNGKASWFKRNVLSRMPLYRLQACGNLHPVWDRLCFCRRDEHKAGWHGGILDLRTGEEYLSYDDYSKRVQWHKWYNADVTFREPPAFVSTPADRIAVAARKVTEAADGATIIGAVDKEELDVVLKTLGVPAGIIQGEPLPEGAYARYPKDPRCRAVHVRRGDSPLDLVEDDPIGIGG